MEVAITGVTMGMVLQMTVDEVDCLVMAVSDVTTDVEVLVLVTVRGLVFWHIWPHFVVPTYRHKSK